MFIKGMKYELRSVARIVLPLLIIFLCAAMLMSLGFMMEGRIFQFSEGSETNAALSAIFALTESLLGIGIVLLMVAINITVYILIIHRFYMSFFTDEAYLTFTLPVTMDCHLMIKIVSMFFWNVATLVVTILGALIIFGGLTVGYTEQVQEAFSYFSYIKEILQMHWQSASDNLGAQLVVTVLNGLTEYIFQSLLIYFSITLGCMLFKKHRLLGAILSFFVINTLESWIRDIFQSLITGFGLKSGTVYLLQMIFSIVFMIVGMIAFYLGTRYILQKKLNLD
jgi:hypothetical protein